MHAYGDLGASQAKPTDRAKYPLGKLARGVLLRGRRRIQAPSQVTFACEQVSNRLYQVAWCSHI